MHKPTIFELIYVDLEQFATHKDPGFARVSDNPYVLKDAEQYFHVSAIQEMESRIEKLEQELREEKEKYEKIVSSGYLGYGWD